MKAFDPVIKLLCAAIVG